MRNVSYKWVNETTQQRRRFAIAAAGERGEKRVITDSKQREAEWQNSKTGTRQLKLFINGIEYKAEQEQQQLKRSQNNVEGKDAL